MESRLLEIIRATCAGLEASTGLEVGPGDDAAVMGSLGPGRVVFCSDAMVEGSHFHRGLYSPHWIGRRAVASCLSDIVAMGAQPLSVCLSLCPPPLTWIDLQEWVRIFYTGVAEELRLRRVSLAGGDLISVTQSGLSFVDVSAVGCLAQGLNPVLRSGARPGQLLAVSAPLGRASASRRRIERRSPRFDDPWGLRSLPESREAEASSPFLCPTPRTDLLPFLQGKAKSLIDVSDGLVRDAYRLARASAVDLEIDLDIMKGWIDDQTGLDDVLHGGDDYELLGTFEAVPEGFIQIGRVITPQNRSRPILISHDAEHGRRPLEDRGFDHFDSTTR